MSQDGQGWSTPKHGDFCWTEIASIDAGKCKSFYTNVFGWQFQGGKDSAGGFEYNEFTTGSPAPVGGLYEITEGMFGGNTPPPHFMIYVAVDNVDDSAKRTVELGGTIMNGPMDIPNIGRMCVIQDPTGATIALFTMKHNGNTE